MVRHLRDFNDSWNAGFTRSRINHPPAGTEGLFRHHLRSQERGPQFSVLSYAGRMVKQLIISCTFALITFCAAQNSDSGTRLRAAELGLKVGVLPTGPLDAITDVSGVEVGHTTIVRGENIRTGVTAILPHAGNLYREKVPGGIFVGNGFGR